MFTLPYDADTLLLGRCPKRPTSYPLHRHVLSMFMADRCSTHIARKWKQLTCPSSDERTMKTCCIYTMERYSAVKGSEIMNFAGKWMETENIIFAKVNQTQKDKHHMFSLI